MLPRLAPALLSTIDISRSRRARASGHDFCSLKPYGHCGFRPLRLRNQSRRSTVSVSDISSPWVSGKLPSPLWAVIPIHLCFRKYAHVTNYASSTISVVDISNPLAPVQVATTTVGSNPWGIAVSGRYAYVGNQGSASLSVVDISNPAAPTQVATTTINSNPEGIYLAGRYVYIADASNSFSAVDVSNPLAPRQVASVGAGFTPTSVFVSGRYAYPTNYGNFGLGNMEVFDISGTETTSLVAGSADFGQLQVRNDAIVAGQLQIQGGLNVELVAY